MTTDPLQTARPLAAAPRYRPGAIAFHWIMFVLVLLVGVLGLLHDSWPDKSQSFWINIHAVLGTLLWVTLFARFSYRLRHAPPLLPEGVGRLTRRWSNPVHIALYVLMFVIPIVGYVTFFYHGRVLDFGVLKINPGITKDRAIFHPTETLHQYLAYALFALAGLHALAALWHRFYLHDGVMQRMGFKRS